MLYSIQFLHQITTGQSNYRTFFKLYSIQFLHQITTYRSFITKNIKLYSIQFLHQITTRIPLHHRIPGVV